MEVSASVQVPPTLHLLLTGPVPEGAVTDRLARWFGRGDALPKEPGLPREHAARLAGLDAPVAWAALWESQAGRTIDREDHNDLLLFLEPVRMEAGMNDVAMAPLRGALDPAGIAVLADLLAPVLADAGLDWHPAQQRLLLRMRGPLSVHCWPPEWAYRHPLRDKLPTGPDAGRVRRLLTECQMVLHQAREAERVLPGDANAVWAWGEGQVQAIPGLAVRLYSDDPLVRACLRAPASAAPNADSAIRACQHALHGGSTLNDAQVVQASAGDAELDVLLVSAETALRQGRLSAIELTLWHPDRLTAPEARCRLRSRQLWRWWRRPQRSWEPQT